MLPFRSPHHYHHTLFIHIVLTVVALLPSASSFSSGPSRHIVSASRSISSQPATAGTPSFIFGLHGTLTQGDNEVAPPITLSWNNSFATEQIGDLQALMPVSPTVKPAFGNDWNVPFLPDICAAVIIPGFLTGKDDFVSMANSLNSMGIPTVVVPMPTWHWLPCLGGRSIRPMLERIDFTVRHLAAVAGNLGDYGILTTEGLQKTLDGTVLKTNDDCLLERGNERQQKDPQLLIPNFSYSLMDCYNDCLNNPGGPVGSADLDELHSWNPKGSFPTAPPPMGKVALIGHSAGGWLGRAYLSQRDYGGKFYGGRQLVHSLITLGSPHGNAPGPAFEGVKWVNTEIMDSSSQIRALAVGGKGFRGDCSGMLTQSSYAFCCSEKSDGSQYDGDGVTPIHSALSMKEYVPHADTLVLDGVGHFCWGDIFSGKFVAPDLTKGQQESSPWYGDKATIEKWAEWL